PASPGSLAKSRFHIGARAHQESLPRPAAAPPASFYSSTGAPSYFRRIRLTAFASGRLWTARSLLPLSVSQPAADGPSPNTAPFPKATPTPGSRAADTPMRQQRSDFYPHI